MKSLFGFYIYSDYELLLARFARSAVNYRELEEYKVTALSQVIPLEGVETTIYFNMESLAPASMRALPHRSCEHRDFHQNILGSTIVPCNRIWNND